MRGRNRCASGYLLLPWNRMAYETRCLLQHLHSALTFRGRGSDSSRRPYQAPRAKLNGAASSSWTISFPCLVGRRIASPFVQIRACGTRTDGLLSRCGKPFQSVQYRTAASYDQSSEHSRSSQRYLVQSPDVGKSCSTSRQKHPFRLRTSGWTVAHRSSSLFRW